MHQAARAHTSKLTNTNKNMRRHALTQYGGSKGSQSGHAGKSALDSATSLHIFSTTTNCHNTLKTGHICFELMNTRCA